MTAAAGPNANEPFQMQDGTTADLLFGVAELISIISQEVTLDPGDIIVTGTPSGVGVFREPQVFLEPGDVVTVEIEGIGQPPTRSLTSTATSRGFAAAKAMQDIGKLPAAERRRIDGRRAVEPGRSRPAALRALTPGRAPGGV